MKQILLIFTFLTAVVSASAARVDTLMLESPSMNKIIPNVVITPDGYKNKGKAFPVLYLLHGATDSYKGWVTRVPAIKDYADQYGLIIVCPDGGYTSWYFDSPVDEQMQYETYVSQELIKAIDSRYHTVNNANGRAITGLSMGGHGALYLAFRHQDVWSVAGSMSGGVDIRPFPNNWDIAKRLGVYAEFPERWEHNTVINLLHLLNGKDLRLIFDCGVDDFFYDANCRLHQLMVERNIPHDFISRPGRHNWNYWANAIQFQLLFFSNHFKEKGVLNK